MGIYLLDVLGGGIAALPLTLILIFVFDRERAKRRWHWMVLLTLYLGAMYITVGVPAIQYVAWDPTVNLIPFQDLSPSNLTGMVLNVVMFAPLGFLLPAFFDRYAGFWKTLCAGLLTSLTVELIQLFTFRVTDIDDLIMNTLGTAAGFLLAKLILHRRLSVYRGKRDWLELLGVNAIILLETVFIRYPMMEQIWKLL